MQKGLPISQDSLSTKNKLEEILAGLVAPSKPMAWCPAQLYAKNTQMCQTHLLGEEDGGEVQAGGCSVARSLQTSMGGVSPHHTELSNTLVFSITSNPMEITGSSAGGKVHGLATRLLSPSSSFKHQPGLCKPSVLRGGSAVGNSQRFLLHCSHGNLINYSFC